MNAPLQLKEQYLKAIAGFNTGKNIVYTISFVLSILFSIGMIGYWWMIRQELNAKANSLSSTATYSLDALQNDESIKDSFPLRKNLSDMLWYEAQIDENIKNTQLQRQRLSVPFDNFFNLFYTPSVNIWRDPFSLKIDTWLIGKNYIEKNPYGDIALIQQWTNFFKDVGVVDSYNTVNDVRIGKAEPSLTPWYFSIPITVQFEAPNKRSFLLLINKISMTAYIQNLSLINEFMYYLRETIKEEKTDVLKDDTLFSGILATTPDNHDDRVIWYLLYDWIVQWNDNKLINQSIISKTIRKSAWCTTEEQPQCLYMFREKMRALPYLAYGITRDGVDVVEWLKFFFKNIPPILSIESFSFEDKIVKKTKAWYKGSITFKIYGKDILQEEIDNISSELWWLCFLSKEALGINNSKARVEKNINELGKWNLNIKRSSTLNQILVFINKIEQEYPTLSNHKKVVRLFELYRTLKENSLCDIIKTEEIATVVEATKTDWQTIEQIIDFNDMTTDKINNIEIQSGSDATATTQTGAQQITSTWDLWTGTEENRTIGDGNSKRDAQLTNELNAVDQQ